MGELDIAIIDTGSSISYINSDILSNIIYEYGGNCNQNDGLYYCDCSGVSSFKDLYFGFGSENDTDYKTVQVKNDNYVIYEDG